MDIKNETLRNLVIGKEYRHLLVTNTIPGREGEDWIIHNVSTMSQADSLKLLCEVVNQGHCVNVMTRDGLTFTNVNPNEIRVKLVYNTSVNSGDNCMIAWSLGVKRMPMLEQVKLAVDSAVQGILKVDYGFKLNDPRNIIRVSGDALFNGAMFNGTVKAAGGKQKNKYKRTIKTVDAYDANGKPVKIDVDVDVYDVIRAYGVVSGPLQHALKKVLAPGQRGHKDTLQDLRDIIASVEREIEMQEGK